MVKQRDGTKELADELGYVLARYYIVIERMIRESERDRLRLKASATRLLGSMPRVELLEYLDAHGALVADGFRAALTGRLRSEAKEALGFSEADFDHIAAATPGNPDIGVGGVFQPTGNGNTLVGPAVTVTEGHVTLKLGGGVEVEPPDRPPGLSVEGIRNAAGSAIKGVGVAIGVQIDC